MKIYKIYFIILAFCFVAINSYGQEVKKLTLEQSLQIGLKNSNILHSSRQNVIAAKARLSEINSSRLPSLSFNAVYTRLSKIDPFAITTPFGNFELAPSIVNNYVLKLSLQQPLFTGFRLSSSSNIAEYNSLAANENYTKDEQNLIFKIKNEYWNLFKAEKFKEVIDENVAQIKAHLNDVQNLFKQGLSTKNDVLKVQVQLAEAELRQIDAKNAVQLANINLNNTINQPLSTQIEIETKVDSRPIDMAFSLDLLLNKAYENRPELKAVKYQIKAGESGVTLAQSGWYPQVYLAGNYNYARPNQRIFPTTDEFKGTWDVSISLQFNIWNWGQTVDQTDQAEAKLEQAKDGLKILKDGITLEVTQNYLAMLKAKEKIAVSENNVSQAEENYRVTDEKFKNGLTLNSELLDAEFALMQSKTNYIQSLVDYEIALAQLDKSIGK